MSVEEIAVGDHQLFIVRNLINEMEPLMALSICAAARCFRESNPCKPTIPRRTFRAIPGIKNRINFELTDDAIHKDDFDFAACSNGSSIWQTAPIKRISRGFGGPNEVRLSQTDKSSHKA